MSAISNRFDPFNEDEEEEEFPEAFGDWEDKSPLGPEGCCFPGECCMPGPHYESECHTAEMLLAQEHLIDPSHVEKLRKIGAQALKQSSLKFTN